MASIESLRADLARAKADLSEAEKAKAMAEEKQRDAARWIKQLEHQIRVDVGRLPDGRMKELVDWAIRKAEEIGKVTKPMVLIDTCTCRRRITQHPAETHPRFLVNDHIWFSKNGPDGKRVPREDKLLVRLGHEHTSRVLMGGINEENTALIEIDFNRERQVYTVKLGHAPSYDDTRGGLDFEQAKAYLVRAME